MSKLSREELDRLFSTIRFDHPGRRGVQPTAEPKHRDPFHWRRTDRTSGMYLIQSNGYRPIRNREISLAEQMAAEAFGDE